MPQTEMIVSFSVLLMFRPLITRPTSFFVVVTSRMRSTLANHRHGNHVTCCACSYRYLSPYTSIPCLGFSKDTAVVFVTLIAHSTAPGSFLLYILEYESRVTYW